MLYPSLAQANGGSMIMINKNGALLLLVFPPSSPIPNNEMMIVMSSSQKIHASHVDRSVTPERYCYWLVLVDFPLSPRSM